MFRQRRKGNDVDDDDKYDPSRKPRNDLVFKLGHLLLWLVSVFLVASLLNRSTHNSQSEDHIFAIDSAMSRIETLERNLEKNLFGPPRGEHGSSKVCSPEQANRQGQYASVAKVRGCPSEDDIWLRFTQLLMPQAKVFIDIGSNKGFTAARFFELWVPELGMNAKELHQALKSTSVERDLLECGACNDCLDAGISLMPILSRFCSSEAERTSDPNMARTLQKAVDSMCTERANSFIPIHVYSFDGNPVMINGVTKARDYLIEKDTGVSRLKSVTEVPIERLPNTPKKKFLQASWNLELAAFSDIYEPGKTVEFILGIGEKGHLSDTQGEPEEDESKIQRAIVPILTVDAFVEREKLSHIDILKMDTEGHDPMVIRGSQQTIRNHRVTLVLFEYNKVWDKSDKLEQVIKDNFDSYGYSCYLEGKNLLLKLTQGCWSNSLELRKWSNVWCISLRRHEGKALTAVFDSYSVAFL